MGNETGGGIDATSFVVDRPTRTKVQNVATIAGHTQLRSFFINKTKTKSTMLIEQHQRQETDREASETVFFFFFLFVDGTHVEKAERS